MGLIVPGSVRAQAVAFSDTFTCPDTSALGEVPGAFGWEANWDLDPWQTDLNDGVSPITDEWMGDGFGGAVDTYENFLLTGHSLWEDVAIEATVSATDDDAVGLVIRYSSTDAYYACWSTLENLPNCQTTHQPRPGNFLTRVDGSGCVDDYVVEQSTGTLRPVGTPFRMRLEIQGIFVTCSFDYDLDGQFGTAGDVTLEWVDWFMPAGKVGLAAFDVGEGVGGAFFDDVVVESWDADTDQDGVPDLVENTMGSANADPDTDGDGIPDAVEYGMQEYPHSSDGDGLEDFRDTDSDGDTIPDFIEVGGDPPVDTDCDGIPDYRDTDSDDDFVSDDIDECRLVFSVPGDTDGDGLGDICDDDPLNPDQDSDGLADGEEVNIYGTDPAVADSDCGGADDGIEVHIDATDPLDPSDDVNGDIDGDGLTNCEETTVHGTDPANPDTDGDGVSDGVEVSNTTDPLLADTDGDGLDDGQEQAQGTDPLVTDTDGDGLEDGPEISFACDPLDPDTDGDTLTDGDEVHIHGTNPVQSDSDGDRVGDAIELAIGDTDGDGLNNAVDDDDDGDSVLSVDEDLDGDLDPTNDDTDGDGSPNYLDDDDDGDTIPTIQEDWDGSGDLNDDDLDSDGVPSWLDGDEIDINRDSDGDGIEDYLEDIIGSDPLLLDSDGDGLLDGDEVGDPFYPVDTDMDGLPDLIDPDDDGDGLLTEDELGDPENPVDTDGDGTPDYLDVDSDGDDVYDGVDPSPLVPGGDVAEDPPVGDPGFGLGCSTAGSPVSWSFLVALLFGIRRRS